MGEGLGAGKPAKGNHSVKSGDSRMLGCRARQLQGGSDGTIGKGAQGCRRGVHSSDVRRHPQDTG
jgi:hypothetical protein